MTSTEFLTHCLRTWNAGLTPSKQYLNATEGLLGESGEVADIFKHQEFHPNKALPVAEFHERLIKEAGDVLYYAAVINKLRLIVVQGVGLTLIVRLRVEIHQSNSRKAIKIECRSLVECSAVRVEIIHPHRTHFEVV